MNPSYSSFIGYFRKFISYFPEYCLELAKPREKI